MDNLIEVTQGELQFVRDTLKEAIECDDVADVQAELKECFEMIEVYLR